MVNSLLGLLKPCYLYSPSTLLRRVGLQFSPPQSRTATVSLPWGMRIEVDLRDAIGSEIYKQRIFDLAVSECAWRVLSPGDYVIDAGANIGYMTLLFAGRIGPSGVVHAFEPHPEVGATLQRNVARAEAVGQPPRVIVHHCALGASAGAAKLFESDYFAINQGTASIANVPVKEDAEGVRTHAVTVAALDELFPQESFALLKIDVEGFEAEVLKGAQALLASHRVKNVIYEDHTLGCSGLAETLVAHGYSIFAIGHGVMGPKLLPVALAAAAIDASWESASFLATIEPGRVCEVMRHKGWRVLRGR